MKSLMERVEKQAPQMLEFTPTGAVRALIGDLYLLGL